MAKFNGHKNWNHWNVSLWINNDEGLYRDANHYFRTTKTLDKAARLLARDLDGLKTPDGAPFTYTTIRAAMRGYKLEYAY
jgi:hypothetical protein